MKLYIATTSLNFDTIMSTESVSPATFYYRRGFGIKLFYDKASFCLPNSILLTDVCPIFSISNKEVEHRPMILEIDDNNYPDDYFKKVKEDDDIDVYQTSKTLYLTPSSCRILFTSQRDLSYTLSKAESIIESKFALYEQLGAIAVVKESYDTVRINAKTFSVADIDTPDDKCIRQDALIDRAKGFVVSYLIGASKALTPDSVRLQRITNEIKNGIYSLRTSDSNNDFKQNAIKDLTSQANSLANKLDPVRQEIAKKIDTFLETTHASELLNGASHEAVLKWLKESGLYQAVFNKAATGLRVVNYSQVAAEAISASEESFGKVMDYIQAYTNSILKKKNVDVSAKNVFKLTADLNCVEINDSSITSESAEKLEIFYNLFKDPSFTTVNIRSERARYVEEAGKALFSRTDDQGEREYFNALLDNLEHAQKFDILMSDSLALQSLAAFMKSPDADIEKLSSLLISSEVADSRIAFGLWGLFYGYSSIPNSLFKELVSTYNVEKANRYISEMNELFFHGKPVFGKTEPKKRKGKIGKVIDFFFGEEKEDDIEVQLAPSNPSTSESSQAKTSYQSSTLFPDEEMSAIKDKQVETFQTVSSANKFTVEQGSDDLPGDFADVYDVLEPIIHSVPGNIKKREEFIRYYCGELKKICYSAGSFAAIKTGIDRIPSPVNKSNWDKLKKPLKDAVVKEQNSKLDSGIKDDISVTRKKSIITDGDAPAVVKQRLNNFVHDSDVLRKIDSGFKYFIKGYQPGGFYDKPGADKSNHHVIDHWVSWCFSEVNKYNRLSNEYRFIIDSVAKKLKEYYGE